MANTITLTNHDEIRDWTAARAGSPALSDASGTEEPQPVLHLVFGQIAYQEAGEGVDRPDGLTVVDWEEWFRLFDELQLALVVNVETPGQRESFHEFIRRPQA